MANKELSSLSKCLKNIMAIKHCSIDIISFIYLFINKILKNLKKMTLI